MIWRFNLPVSDVPARLIVRSRGPLNFRDYVLKFQFAGVEAAPETADLLRVSYSKNLDSLFLYSPQQQAAVARTSFFRLPASEGSLTVHAVPWHVESDGAQLESLGLQIEAPWKHFGKLALEGVAQ